jgi:hypothetical protein
MSVTLRAGDDPGGSTRKEVSMDVVRWTPFRELETME